MGLQYGEDDDLFSDDDEDEDEDEDETEMAAEPPKPVRPISGPSPANNQTRPSGGRRIRMRPMTQRMMASHPEVVLITLTRTDGRQLVFVRR